MHVAGNAWSEGAAKCAHSEGLEGADWLCPNAVGIINGSEIRKLGTLLPTN